MDGLTTRRHVVATAAGAVATGTVAARLARLERALPAGRDGDPLVVAIEGLDGKRAVRGTIGRSSRVVVFRERPDGPQ